MRHWIAAAAVLALAGGAFAADTANFDDVSLPPGGYYNGSDGAGSFLSGYATFSNNYDTLYGSWDGWACSNKTDANTAGWGNQYSAITGGGQGGTGNYGVAYYSSWAAAPPTVTFYGPRRLDHAWFTNTAYAYLAMRDGDMFSKKFGGADANDPDWFLLTITGKNGLSVTGTIDFYLADYRFENNAEDYLVGQWTLVDLDGLGLVTSLEFALTSSDTGDWGMNTPAYFAMDTLVPEPATLCLLGLGSLAAIRRRRPTARRHRNGSKL